MTASSLPAIPGVSSTIAPLAQNAPRPSAEQDLRDVAQRLEASFLTEMLKQAGLGEARDAFGGGTGEDQFASFLRTEHARLLSERGGLGLSEMIFQSLVARQQAGGGP